MTKIDALKRLQKSLTKLASTAPSPTLKVRRKVSLVYSLVFLSTISKEIQDEFTGFEQLFSRYLLESVDVSSINWQQIQPPPEDTVNEKGKTLIRFEMKSFLQGYSI